MSHGRMRKKEKRLEAEITEILRRLDEVNQAEDEEHGEDDDGGGGLPAELTDRRKRQQRIRELPEQLEAEKGEKLEGRHRKSFADPDAHMMKTGGGSFHYAYNAQTAAGLHVPRGMLTTSLARGAMSLEESLPDPIRPLTDSLERPSPESVS